MKQFTVKKKLLKYISGEKPPKSSSQLSFKYKYGKVTRNLWDDLTFWQL